MYFLQGQSRLYWNCSFKNFDFFLHPYSQHGLLKYCLSFYCAIQLYSTHFSHIYYFQVYVCSYCIFLGSCQTHPFPEENIYIFLFCIYCRNMFFHSTSYLFFSANECFHTIFYKIYWNRYFLHVGFITYAATHREK